MSGDSHQHSDFPIFHLANGAVTTEKLASLSYGIKIDVRGLVPLSCPSYNVQSEATIASMKLMQRRVVFCIK